MGQEQQLLFPAAHRDVWSGLGLSLGGQALSLDGELDHQTRGGPLPGGGAELLTL